MVGEVLVLYVTVLVLAVCVCVVLAIEKRGTRDDRYYRPTYLRILLLSLLSYLLPFSKYLFITSSPDSAT